MADRVVHFEITADDPERAREFYRRSFGWEIKNWAGPIDYWLVSSGEGPGIDGGITARMHHQAVINTVAVDGRLEDAVAWVVAAGGAQVSDLNLIPGVGRITYASDTEGNVFGMLEPMSEQ